MDRARAGSWTDHLVLRRGRDAAARLPRLGRTLGYALVAERERWPLWLPVALAAGIALYFVLPVEPVAGVGLGAVAAAAALALLGWMLARRGRAGQGLVVVALVIGGVALGFAVARWHAGAVAAPVIAKRVGPVTLTGRLVVLEPGPKGARVTLADPVIARLAPGRTPKRVRLRLRVDGKDLHIGDMLRLRAILMPPPAPSAPGGFDFAREAWFMGLGGVGFALGRPEIVARADVAAEGPFARLHATLAEARRDLYQRVIAAVPGAAGAIAAALITGERGAIPEDVMDSMRRSGLAHLLAISGLHVGLVTGALFFGLRAFLALFPALALRFPIKKWAALAALLGGAGYMAITGATVPTQRAFLMAGLVFIAVLADRAAISMRLVAWAAAVVLLIAPESLLGPSFQMSFAAVVALVATYETARPAFARLRSEGGVLRRAAAYGAGVLLTTLVAGLATAPFALYHFNRVAAFGLIANLGAVPITALWIMPLATLAFLLVPFGLEGFALTPMAWGIDAVIAIARHVASWPGAALHVPQMPIAALALIAFGGLWLALWRTRLRFAGVMFVVLGIVVAFHARPPDVLVAGDAKSFAVRGPDGRLVFAGARLGTFARTVWLRRVGLDDAAATSQPARNISVWPRPRAGGALACDTLACLYRAHGRMVSIIRSPGAAYEDCAEADVVVALVPLRRMGCRGPVRVIGRFDLWREGAYAIWLAPHAIRVESVADWRGNRPWVIRHGRRGRAH